MRRSITSGGGSIIAEEVADTEKPGFRLAKLYLEKNRAAAQKITQSFKRNWEYLRGQNRWPTPTNQYHMSRDGWKAKTVRNRLQQVLSQKAAMVLEAPWTVHAEPVTDDVSTEHIELASMVVKAEMKRLRWNEVREDVFLEGSVNGKAFAHFYTKKDRLAEAMGIEQAEICVELADSTRLYPDTSATRITHCRILQYEPSLDYSRACEAFPDAKDKLKPTGGQKVGELGSEDPVRRTRSEDELLTGPAGDIVLGKDGSIQECKVDVCMTWIVDNDSLSKEAKYKLDEETGEKYEDGTDYKRSFPYGRLIVSTKDSEIYDGESPYEIVTVFPFSEFTYDRNPDKFWSPGIVDSLKSGQMVADKTMAMALDGARKVLFGNLEAPISAEGGYHNKGNAPDEVIFMPPELMGMARYLSPNNVNMQLLSWIDDTNRRDFQEMSGVSDVLTGGVPVAPTSGKELQTRAKLASTRPGRDLRHLNEFDSDSANILFQLMRQNYVGERVFMVESGLNGEIEAIRADVSQLPPGIAIRIESDPDEIEKDALEGQNVQALVESGRIFDPMFIPFMATLLPSYSIRPQKAKELQRIAVQMVTVGVIPTDPMMYQMITGAPMPPELFAKFQAQQMMAMAAAGPQNANEKPANEPEPQGVT